MIHTRAKMIWVTILLFITLGTQLVAADNMADIAAQSGYVKGEMIYALDNRPTPQCHASTIVESKHGLVAAWFGGKHEKHPGVGIWVSRNNETGWSIPVEVANGVQSEGKRFPCWNPVLFQPSDGPLMLFYKVGPDPRLWWGMLMTSPDGGKTWSSAKHLPDGIYGPIKNKPVQLQDGILLCPTSSEVTVWQVYFNITPDMGRTWTAIGPVRDPKSMAAIQPTILTYPDGRLQALCRTEQKRIGQTWSSDNGKTWTEIMPTDLPNPNSGIDAVTLSDGRQILVYNNTTKGRSPLNVAVSSDGKQWKNVLVLENKKGEFSYPAVIQLSDGKVHISYTYLRQTIKHVIVDPSRLQMPKNTGAQQITPGDDK